MTSQEIRANAQQFTFHFLSVLRTKPYIIIIIFLAVLIYLSEHLCFWFRHYAPVKADTFQSVYPRGLCTDDILQ